MISLSLLSTMCMAVFYNWIIFFFKSWQIMRSLIIVHYQYFSNIYYLILCDIYSNRLKLLSCILFMISSLFIRLLIKIQIRNLKKSVSRSKYKSEIWRDLYHVLGAGVRKVLCGHILDEFPTTSVTEMYLNIHLLGRHFH